MAWRLTPTTADTSALEGFVNKTKDKIEYILGAKKIIMFVDHATCHKSPGTKRFIRDHKSILKVKLLAKRAPRLNPVEGDVNRPLKSVVCTK